MQINSSAHHQHVSTVVKKGCPDDVSEFGFVFEHHVVAPGGSPETQGVRSGQDTAPQSTHVLPAEAGVVVDTLRGVFALVPQGAHADEDLSTISSARILEDLSEIFDQSKSQENLGAAVKTSRNELISELDEDEKLDESFKGHLWEASNFKSGINYRVGAARPHEQISSDEMTSTADQSPLNTTLLQKSDFLLTTSTLSARQPCLQMSDGTGHEWTDHFTHMHAGVNEDNDAHKGGTLNMNASLSQQVELESATPEKRSAPFPVVNHPRVDMGVIETSEQQNGPNISAATLNAIGLEQEDASNGVVTVSSKNAAYQENSGSSGIATCNPTSPKRKDFFQIKSPSPLQYDIESKVYPAESVNFDRYSPEKDAKLKNADGLNALVMAALAEVDFAVLIPQSQMVEKSAQQEQREKAQDTHSLSLASLENNLKAAIDFSSGSITTPQAADLKDLNNMPRAMAPAIGSPAATDWRHTHIWTGLALVEPVTRDAQRMQNLDLWPNQSEVVWNLVSSETMKADQVSFHLDPREGARAVTLPRYIIHALDQVLHKGSDGQFELTIGPEEIGKLRFEITTIDNKLHITLFAERPDTLDLIRRNGDQLLNDLRLSGFGNSSLSFGDWSNRNSRSSKVPNLTGSVEAMAIPVDQPAPSLQFNGPADATRLDLRL
ncbi:MAG: flagellar hook-length control protein FliK [Paracoccaceae bacterium]